MAGTTTTRGGGRRGAAARRPSPGPAAPRRRLRLPGPRLRRPLALLLLLALLGGFGTWVLYGSDWLRVEDVSVRWTDGSRHELTEDEILAAAEVPVGSPLASLDGDAVRDRLLERLPRLDSVDVERSWPHGVRLSVTEREARVLMPAGDGWAEVDEDGVVFAEAAEPMPGVPLLELDLADGASLRRFGEDRVRRAAVEVAMALPAAVRRETRVVRATSYDAISLELSGDRTVLWGSAEDSAAKAAALLAAMEAAGDARHFDVSAPSAPAVAEG